MILESMMTAFTKVDDKITENNQVLSKLGTATLAMFVLVAAPEIVIPAGLIGIATWCCCTEGKREAKALTRQKEYVNSLPKGSAERDLEQLRYRRMLRQARSARVRHFK